MFSIIDIRVGALWRFNQKIPYKDNERERNFQDQACVKTKQKRGRSLLCSVIITHNYPSQQDLTRKDEQQICTITDGKSQRVWDVRHFVFTCFSFTCLANVNVFTLCSYVNIITWKILSETDGRRFVNTNPLYDVVNARTWRKCQEQSRIHFHALLLKSKTFGMTEKVFLDDGRST